jgi:hypothetical protein
MPKLFISYSHADEAYRAKIQTVIKSLRLPNLTVWDDREFEAGDEYARIILEWLRAADLILLLISHDFMASDYCYNIELPIALERHTEGTAKVLPIIVRACNWQKHSFGKLYAIPSDGKTDGKPIADFPNPDHAYQQVGESIQKAIAQSRAQTNFSESALNPFIYGNPVPPEKFYGRRRERLEVKSRISTRQSINIVGQRRIGKSSLLNYIQARPGEFFAVGQQPLMVRLDLTDERFYSADGIVEGLRRGIKKHLGQELWQAEENRDAWAVHLGLELLRDQHQLSLIVMLDEFEAIASRLEQFESWGEDWRSKASEELFTLVVASKRPVGEVYKVLGLTSPFDNIFSTTVLGALEQNAWQKLVKDGLVALETSLEKLNWIDRLTGGLPFYVQMAASLLWQCRDEAEAEQIFVYDVQPRFRVLWNNLSDLEREVIQQIGTDHHFGYREASIVNQLQRYSIVRADGRLFSSAFEHFVKEQQ